MSEIANYRRVVTGLGADGKSCFIVDGPLLPSSQSTAVAWRTDTIPADNSGTGDIATEPFTFERMHDGSSHFIVAEYQPGQQAYWHATDTIDYIVVLKGEVVLELEAGEVRAGAGDFIVDRGVIHSWRNDGPQVAVTAIVTLPAYPVGRGRNV